jgi:hypothetical protein
MMTAITVTNMVEKVKVKITLMKVKIAKTMVKIAKTTGKEKTVRTTKTMGREKTMMTEMVRVALNLLTIPRKIQDLIRVRAVRVALVVSIRKQYTDAWTHTTMKKVVAKESILIKAKAKATGKATIILKWLQAHIAL